MKKAITYFLGICTILLTACSSNSSGMNTAVTNLTLQLIDDNNALAYIVNMPTEEQLQKVANVETYGEDSFESFLFIPKNNNSSVKIYSLIYENDELNEDELLYSADNTIDDYALHIKTIRPEGIPFLKVVIENGEDKGEYIVAYNGRDGTPDIEVVKKD